MDNAEHMREYWDPENILVDDHELIVLRVLSGPIEYRYAVAHRPSEAKMEFSLSIDGAVPPAGAVKAMEKRLVDLTRALGWELNGPT
jgi:hypothetical protein